MRTLLKLESRNAPWLTGYIGTTNGKLKPDCRIGRTLNSPPLADAQLGGVTAGCSQLTTADPLEGVAGSFRYSLYSNDLE